MLRLFCQDLGAFPAARARSLSERIAAETGHAVDAVFALAWPDYQPPVAPIPQQNREGFAAWRQAAGLPLWAWIVCSADQAADALAIERLHEELQPDGWKLNIEKVLEGASLEILSAAAHRTGAPVSASLAGVSAAHTPYDYRCLGKYGIECDWQAYFDSQEGPTPADAVRELYQSSFVHPGWEYRHRLGKVYGWGRVGHVEQGQLAHLDSFKRPGSDDATFAVAPRSWGFTVVSRTLRRADKNVGVLLGRAAYPLVAVTLDVTRTAQQRLPDEWVPIAASARFPGASKRPVSVYLAENASDDVLAAIARGGS